MNLWGAASLFPHFIEVIRIIDTARAVCEAMGGNFEENPLGRVHKFVTAHPLGGCPMGRDEDEGVVDCHGQVFNYPDLYVADGSVMPGPVGPNPSLTIAALADRFADHILASRNRWPRHEP